MVTKGNIKSLSSALNQSEIAFDVVMLMCSGISATILQKAFSCPECCGYEPGQLFCRKSPEFQLWLQLQSSSHRKLQWCAQSWPCLLWLQKLAVLTRFHLWPQNDQSKILIPKFSLGNKTGNHPSRLHLTIDYLLLVCLAIRGTSWPPILQFYQNPL